MEKYLQNDKIKDAILDYLSDTDAHPTAEDIYKNIKTKYKDINKEQFKEELYNLEKKKKIAIIASLDNNKHYDIRTYNHYHFICENCGIVRDVLLEVGSIQMLIDHAQILVNSFAKIKKVNLSFEGICHNCRKKY